MEILQATIADAEEILTLQKLAYQSEAERYSNYNIPPFFILSLFGQAVTITAIPRRR